ncbi:MAG: DUF5372 family protein [Steroidobacteraceae bacterium]
MFARPTREFPRRPYLKSATAGRSNARTIRFEITHAFHPKRGIKLVLATRKQNWGEDRLMYFDAQGALRSMLTSWTSVADQDLFAQASAGRSWFRTDDLVRLTVLLNEIQRRSTP